MAANFRKTWIGPLIRFCNPLGYPYQTDEGRLAIVRPSTVLNKIIVSFKITLHGRSFDLKFKSTSISGDLYYEDTTITNDGQEKKY